MKIIDSQKIGLKILRFDVLKYPSTSSKAVIRRKFKFVAGDRRFECVVSAREAKTATDALLQAVERLRCFSIRNRIELFEAIMRWAFA